MARTNLTSGSQHTIDRDAGDDITALAGDAISTGAGNGLIVPYKANGLLVLKNATGFAATATVKTVNPTQAKTVNLTIGDKTVAVADGKTILYPMSGIFRQADEVIWVDCDQAISVAVLSL